MRPASTEAPGWCDPLKGSAAALNELHSDSGVIGHAVLAQAMFGHVARSLWNALGVVAALAPGTRGLTVCLLRSAGSEEVVSWQGELRIDVLSLFLRAF